MDTGIILGIIGILLGIVSIAVQIYRRRKLLNSIYDVKWKSTAKLKPKEVMWERGSPKTGFHDYYSTREEDDSILAKIENRENVLIVGPPLAGKTRAAYQAFKRLSKPHDVIIPKCNDITPETFLVPRDYKFWRPRILFLDDLHKFVEKKGFELLLRFFLGSDTIIVATCRSGIEYKKVEVKIGSGNIDPGLIFGGSGIELKTIAEEEGKLIADAVNIPWANVNFNGTVGSILLPLREMEIRFDQCNREEKTILRAIKRLFDSGIYKAKQFFPLDWIKIVCGKKYELVGKKYEWKNWLEGLKGKEFVKLEEEYLFSWDSVPGDDDEKLKETLRDDYNFDWVKDAEILKSDDEMTISIFNGKNSVKITIEEEKKKATLKISDGGTIELKVKKENGKLNIYGEEFVWMEEVYLEAVVKLEEVITNLNVFREMKDFFTEVPDALFLLGNRAHKVGSIELEKAEFMKIAIEAYEEALEVYTPAHLPLQYAMTQNNLGNAYRTLAEVEGKAENCKRAIEAYERALKVYTPARFPLQHAMTQNNLGTAYQTLAEVAEKAENSKRAIEAYEEALEVRTRDRFPLDYAATMNNLGTAYQTLAEVEGKAENSKRAIEACEEALKVYTRDRFPMQYAATMNNLGTAYGTLAEVEAKAENCRRAIEAYGKALKVYTRDRFPMQYAATMNNLGNAYVTLAEVEAKAENCRRAIEAYEEALKVYTREIFPIQYSSIKNNLEVVSAILGANQKNE
jgi:tetratricopeptide (TPR) repeat protein